MPQGTVPTDGSVPDMFMTTQADSPMNGTIWGLPLKYNLSIVDTLSDFILPKKTTDDDREPAASLRPVLLNADEGIVVRMSNSTRYAGYVSSSM